MDGASRALGCPIDATLAGRTYLLEPLTLGRLGACEHHLLAERPTPREAAARLELAAGRPVAPLWERALGEWDREKLRAGVAEVELGEILAWIWDEGLAHAAWLCLRDNHPSLECLEDMQALLRRASPMERLVLRQRLWRVSGFDEVSALDWADGPAASSQRKLAPWRQNLRKLLEVALPQDARGWTLYQWRMLTCREEDLVSRTVAGGRARRTKEVDAGEAAAIMQRMRERTEAEAGGGA